MWGEGDLRNGEQALSARVVLEADGSVGDATWDFNVKKATSYYKKPATEDINNLIIFAGHDWEKLKQKPFSLPAWMLKGILYGERELTNKNLIILLS